MMTPHVNPSATEYAIVVRGVGRLQVAFPNGTLAMDTHIKEGDVFFIPRYFAFSQIAANVSDEPLDFFGFTTSAKKNKPQFLVGANSLMKSMMGPELAAAFGVNEDTMKNILNAQHESVILPSSVGH
jgi:oxalate decarboxylase/phosphoglucose isomerase-like protein (cupin superfamily)